MINAWQWEKSKAIAFPACKCKSRLNFRVRGQFEINILKVLLMNTTYFIWILKKLNLSLWSFEKYELVSGYLQKIHRTQRVNIPEPAIRSGDTGQQKHYFDSCQLTFIRMANIRINRLRVWVTHIRPSCSGKCQIVYLSEPEPTLLVFWLWSAHVPFWQQSIDVNFGLLMWL